MNETLDLGEIQKNKVDERHNLPDEETLLICHRSQDTVYFS